jgi:hypothetical protein
MLCGQWTRCDARTARLASGIQLVRDVTHAEALRLQGSQDIEHTLLGRIFDECAAIVCELVSVADRADALALGLFRR